MKVGMISLGCTKNLVDSETALGLFKDAGYAFTGDPAEADVLMVNTCGFIGPAKEESIDTILEMAQYKQTGNCKLLVVTGCLAQRYEKALMEEIPEIDLLMGVNQYDQLVGAVDAAMKDHKRRSLCGVKKPLWSMIACSPHRDIPHISALATGAATAAPTARFR